MILGYAMDSDHQTYHNVLPLQGIEGLSAQLCGLFIDFIDSIMHLAMSLDQPRTALEWTTFVHFVIEHFFLPDATEEIALQHVRDTLEMLCEHTEHAQFIEPITHATFYAWLNEKINAT